MPSPKTTRRTTLNICPNRVPYFGFDNPGDRNLAETMIVLNRLFMRGPRRPRETSTEGLTRLGFLRSAE